MSFIVGELVAPITVDMTGFRRGLDEARREGDAAARRVSAQFKAVGTNMRQLGTQLSLVMTVPLIAAAAGAFKAGDSVDKALKLIQQGTGETGDALQALGDDFESVFARVPQDSDAVAQVLASLNTRTGLAGEALRGLTKDVLDFARVAKTDAVSVVGLLTRVFGDWSIATENQREALNKMLRAVQASDIGLAKLAELVVGYGAGFRQLGFSFEDATALLAKWEKEGVNVETLLSGMKFALGTFAREGRVANVAIKETVERIQELGATGEATQLALETFGQRAASDMTAAILEGRFEITELLDVMENGQSTIAQTAAETLTLGEKFSILRNRVVLAAQPLGEELIDALEDALPLIEGGATHLGTLVEKFTKLPDSVKGTVLAVGGLLALLGPMAFLLGGIVQGIGALIPMLPVVTAGVASLGTTLTLAAAALGTTAASLTALVGSAALFGAGLGRVLEPIVSKYTGLNKLLSARAPHDELVRNLTRDRAAYLDHVEHLQRLKRSLELTGEQWRISSDHTATNARRVVELTEKARALHRVKVQEAKTVRESVEAAKQEQAVIDASNKVTKEQREFIDETILALKARNRELKIGADAYLVEQLAAAGASAAELEQVRRQQDIHAGLIETAAASKDSTRVDEQREQAIQRIVASLERQYDAMVQTNEELALQELATLEAGEATETYAAGLVDSMRAFEAENKAKAEAAVIRARILTLDERQVVEQEKVNELYEEGALSGEEYSRALEEIEERYTALREASKETRDEVGEFARTVKADIENAFVAFFEAADDGFDAMVDSFKRALRRMVAELLASQLMQFFAAFGARLFGGIIGGGFAGSTGAEGEVLAIPKAQGGPVSERATRPGLIPAIARMAGGPVAAVEPQIGTAPIGALAVPHRAGGMLLRAALVVGMPMGGIVSGPGTATSDSVPAVAMPSGRPVALSDGEFIVREAAVRKYGVGVLEQINKLEIPGPRGTPGAAAGGLASEVSERAPDTAAPGLPGASGAASAAASAQVTVSPADPAPPGSAGTLPAPLQRAQGGLIPRVAYEAPIVVPAAHDNTHPGRRSGLSAGTQPDTLPGRGSIDNAGGGPGVSPAPGIAEAAGVRPRQGLLSFDSSATPPIARDATRPASVAATTAAPSDASPAQTRGPSGSAATTVPEHPNGLIQRFAVDLTAANAIVAVGASEPPGLPEGGSDLPATEKTPALQSIAPGRAGGPVPTFSAHYAGGGLLVGPGTGTSDSIPAVASPSGTPIAVSAGEFIMREAAVRRYGVGMMEQINRLEAPDVPAFANGGLIAQQAARFAAGIPVSGGGAHGGDEYEFNYNIDARGGTPGTKHAILSALRQSEDRAVKRAVAATAEARRRGGGFAKTFKGRAAR